MAKESQSRASRHDSKKAAAAYKGPKQKAERKTNDWQYFTSYLYGALLLGCLGLLSGMGLFGGTLKMHHH